MPPNKTFEDLQTLWYSKLKKTGFEDAEQRDGKLKTWSHVYKRNWSAAQFSAKEEYYRLAEHFLNPYAFQSKYEKLIWKMHSEAHSYRDIAKAVRRYKSTANKDSINTIVENLKTEMLKKNNEQTRSG